MFHMIAHYYVSLKRHISIRSARPGARTSAYFSVSFFVVIADKKRISFLFCYTTKKSSFPLFSSLFISSCRFVLQGSPETLCRNQPAQSRMTKAVPSPLFHTACNFPLAVQNIRHLLLGHVIVNPQILHSLKMHTATSIMIFYGSYCACCQMVVYCLNGCQQMVARNTEKEED